MVGFSLSAVCCACRGQGARCAGLGAAGNTPRGKRAWYFSACEGFYTCHSRVAYSLHQVAVSPPCATDTPQHMRLVTSGRATGRQSSPQHAAPPHLF